MRYAWGARLLLVAIGGASIFWIWTDPYTHAVDTSSPFIPAPWWRIALAMTEIVLLGLYCWSAWMMRWRRAALLLIVSLLHSLVTNAVYVLMDGMERFLIVFSTDQILSGYLGVLALRLLALLALTYLYLGESSFTGRLVALGK